MKKSFKSCGISNALDRTEDAIYNEETQELEDEEMEDEFETESEDEADGE